MEYSAKTVTMACKRGMGGGIGDVLSWLVMVLNRDLSLKAALCHKTKTRRMIAVREDVMREISTSSNSYSNSSTMSISSLNPSPTSTAQIPSSSFEASKHGDALHRIRLRRSWWMAEMSLQLANKPSRRDAARYKVEEGDVTGGEFWTKLRGFRKQEEDKSIDVEEIKETKAKVTASVSLLSVLDL